MTSHDRLAAFALEVPVKPHGQGRPRATCKDGYARLYKDPADERYESRIQNAWAFAGRPRLADGAYRLEVVAEMARPADHYKRDGALSAEGLRNPVPRRKPDADNILKAIADTLGGIAFLDDAHMAEARCLKTWTASRDAPERVLIRAELVEAP